MKLLSVMVLVCLCSSAKLASRVKKCDERQADFNDCLSKAILSAVKELEKPTNEYGLPNIEPVLIAEVLKAGNRTTGLEETFTNIKLVGLTKADSVKASMDFKNNKLTAKFTFPELIYVFGHEAHGTISFLPIDTVTSGAFTFKKPTFTLTFKLQEYQKESKKHFKVVESDLVMQAEGMAFYFKLFKNEVLNDHFNAEMAEKWEQIFLFIKTNYSKVNALRFGAIFGNLLEKVAANELFDGF